MPAFKKIAFFSFGLALISHTVYANYWDKDSLLAEKTLSLKTDAIKAILVDAGAGNMQVSGDSQIDSIEVSAKIYGQELAEDEYRLSLEKKVNEPFYTLTQPQNTTIMNELT